MRLKLQSSHLISTGFKRLSVKRVTGFNSQTRGDLCLTGAVHSDVFPNMDANVWVDISTEEFNEEVFFLYGLAMPYQFDKNLGIGFEELVGESFEVAAHNGDTFLFEDARRIEFDDQAARINYPDRLPAFHLCPAFQFGAQIFGE